MHRVGYGSLLSHNQNKTSLILVGAQHKNTETLHRLQAASSLKKNITLFSLNPFHMGITYKPTRTQSLGVIYLCIFSGGALLVHVCRMESMVEKVTSVNQWLLLIPPALKQRIKFDSLKALQSSWLLIISLAFGFSFFLLFLVTSINNPRWSEKVSIL